MFAGIGQVIVLLAITLFIQIKKRDPKIPLESTASYRRLNHNQAEQKRLHQVSNLNTTIVVVLVSSQTTSTIQ